MVADNVHYVIYSLRLHIAGLARRVVDLVPTYLEQTMTVTPGEQDLSDAWDDRFSRARDEEGFSVENATFIADRYVEQYAKAHGLEDSL